MSRAIKAMVADDDVDTAANATEALRRTYRVVPPVLQLRRLAGALELHRPEMLFLDVMWGHVCVLARLRVLLLDHPTMRICMVSEYPVARFASDALVAGALGFLVKPATVNELLTAAAATAAGARFVSPSVRSIAGLENESSRPELANQRPHLCQVELVQHMISIGWLAYALRLTYRQAEVAYAIRDGLAEKQIASRLDCALATVRKHIRDIYARLDAVGIANHGGLAAAVERALHQQPEKWRP